MTNMPIGIRINNPGNIRATKEHWLGATGAQNGFVVFSSPIHGLRAIARLLITYQDRYGLKTPRELITRYAPPSENDTDAYILGFCSETGFAPGKPIDCFSYAVLTKAIPAIVRREVGSWPYTDAQLDKALVMAGIEAPEKPISQTRTVKGAQVATAGTVAAAAMPLMEHVDTIRDALGPHVALSKWIGLALAGVTLLGITYTVWARIDDRRKGLR